MIASTRNHHTLVVGPKERAREKAGDLPIEWIEANVRDFHLGRQFDLIYTAGSVFQHLVERLDQEKMLACVREHLSPDGLFVVDLRSPSRGSVVDAEGQEWYTYEDEKGRTIKVTGTDHYDPVKPCR